MNDLVNKKENESNLIRKKGLVCCAASAPGKLILFGEHAVVHSQLAIAACLSDLRIQTSVEMCDNGLIIIEMPDLTMLKIELPIDYINTKSNEELQKYLEKAYSNLESSALLATRALLMLIQKILSSLLPKKDFGLLFYVSSCELPVGAGLGSSAAFSVATSAALIQLRNKLNEPTFNEELKPSEEDLDEINDFAFLSEKLIHGSPSGIDNTISTYGGAIQYRREPYLREAIENFPPLHVLLTNTNIPRSTKNLVNRVHEYKKEYPLVVNSILDCIGGIARQFMEEISSLYSYARLSYLVKTNQLLLQTIGVSHPMIEEICTFTDRYGVATKLTGAGGGGCVVTFLPDNGKGYEVQRGIERYFKLPCWLTTIGGEGVRYEHAEEVYKIKKSKERRKYTSNRDILLKYCTTGVFGFFFLGVIFRMSKK